MPNRTDAIKENGIKKLEQEDAKLVQQLEDWCIERQQQQQQKHRPHKHFFVNIVEFYYWMTNIVLPIVK